jgi:hypothetical protein
MIALLLWILVYVSGIQLPAPDAWSQADAATQRLNPSELPGLPELLRVDLQRRGCTIPQVYTGGPPHNAIRGAFGGVAPVDWAVLCSRERVSTVIIFWSGDSRRVSEIGTRPDAEFLQVVAPGRIGFSRAISVASADSIREHHRRYGGPDPPLLTHGGIDDAFVGKASIVWYWHQGKWLQLTGAD